MTLFMSETTTTPTAAYTLVHAFKKLGGLQQNFNVVIHLYEVNFHFLYYTFLCFSLCFKL